MTLIETVGRILSKEVTKSQAKRFAYEQYGVLCAHIRNEAFKKLLDEKEEKKIVDFILVDSEISHETSDMTAVSVDG